MIRSFTILGLLLLTLAGCAGAPKLADVDVPVIPQGEGRLYVYRDPGSYESLVETKVYLNGEVIGISRPDSVFYRDVPPGEYKITVDSRLAYPNQFKTILVQPGERRFIQIEPIFGWQLSGEFRVDAGDTFLVDLVDPTVGARQAVTYRYYGGSSWRSGMK